MSPLDLPARMATKIEVAADQSCWEWTGTKRDGYGQFRFDGQMRNAHRVAYALLVGPIPLGLQLDHLCRNRACVNPTHLEPVTASENTRRGNGPAGINARKTHCVHGHALSPENTLPQADGKNRRCKQCLRRDQRAYKARQRDLARAS